MTNAGNAETEIRKKGETRGTSQGRGIPIKYGLIRLGFAPQELQDSVEHSACVDLTSWPKSDEYERNK
jgi:hypothetical protein